MVNYQELEKDDLENIRGGNFLNSLKGHRYLAGYTQEELAEKIYVDVHTVRNWEKGVTEPTGTDLFLMSQIFQVTLDELWDADDKFK